MQRRRTARFLFYWVRSYGWKRQKIILSEQSRELAEIKNNENIMLPVVTMRDMGLKQIKRNYMHGTGPAPLKSLTE